MKLVTWNCNGAFRKKAAQLGPFGVDLAVIQECERPERLNLPDDYCPEWQTWYGDAAAARGIGLFSFTAGRFDLAEDIYDPTIRYCIPLRGRDGFPFNLIAVWAMGQKNNARQGYVTQVWRAVHQYADFIQERDTLWVGDFNSNQVFDAARPAGNHTMLVERLAHSGLTSVYHRYYKESHGSETQPTFYLYKHSGRPFHLDYCFAPQSWPLESVTVGTLDRWGPWSDHCPLFVQFGG